MYVLAIDKQRTQEDKKNTHTNDELKTEKRIAEEEKKNQKIVHINSRVLYYTSIPISIEANNTIAQRQITHPIYILCVCVRYFFLLCTFVHFFFFFLSLFLSCKHTHTQYSAFVQCDRMCRSLCARFVYYSWIVYYRRHSCKELRVFSVFFFCLFAVFVCFFTFNWIWLSHRHGTTISCVCVCDRAFAQYYGQTECRRITNTSYIRPATEQNSSST